MIKNKKGFTLIELIVVVAIIGILVAILVPSISGQFDNAKETAAKANAKTFYSASQTAVTTILAGWDVKGPVTQGDFAIPSIYYESGEYRVYFGKNTADSSGEVEPISNAVRTGYVSANETDTTTSATDLQTVKEINKHMKLYLGDNSKLTTDKGGYQLSGGTTPTPPPQPPVEAQDTANPANVTMKIKTTGKNATGTFAGREYQLEVTGLTKDAKYKVTIAGESKGSFTATGATQTVDLKGAFAPVVMGQTTTYKAEVIVVALNPATGVTAEKKRVTHDLAFYDGDGSTATPYLICDAESLEMLSFKVKNDNANFANKNYKQIVSVDMSTVANFVPVGNLDNPFKGTYDGGAKADGTGYAINNLKIESTNEYVGLFGYAYNATLKNIRIGSGSVIKGVSFVGGIVASTKASNIQNCYNSATIIGDNNNDTYVAGIVAYPKDQSRISHSYNTGAITGRYSGGVVGYLIKSDLNYCYNTGTVTGRDGSGGIAVSMIESNMGQTYNTGSITSNRNGGGIVGALYSDSVLENSYNIGQIVSPPSHSVGGVVGLNYNYTLAAKATATNCFNTGNVTGITLVGGAFGENTGGLISTNVLFKNTAVVTGRPDPNADKFNIKYTNISEFVNATGADRSKWDDKGRLLNPDGTLMAGPNPGDNTPPAPPIVVKTTGENKTGTFAGREYFLEVTGLTKNAKYEVKVNGVTKGSFTATGTAVTFDLKGAFAPTVALDTATHTAQVSVVAVNPGNGVTDKGTITHDLSFYEGDGSTATPYLICDPESLEMLSDKVNNDNANFANKNYKQIVSVDMKPVANFVPIGNFYNQFKGTYDGGAKADGTGYEIKNLTIERYGNDIGLFGKAENATLKNIRIGRGSVIKGDVNVGGIVGDAGATTIENCYNTAPVTGGYDVGGIAGSLSSGTITQSSNTGDIKGENSRYFGVGGIVGDVRDLTSKGVVNITYCFNTGRVESVTTSTGGIVGVFQTSGTIAQVYNTGSVTGGTVNTGGVIGLVTDSARTPRIIGNIYNTGEVRGAGEHVGGVIGYAYSPYATLINCFNTGNVTGTTKVGGSVGAYNNGVTITNSRFKNTVVVTGTPDANATTYNVKYTSISDFLNATTATHRSKWDSRGRLLNPDGTLMAGPNPGGA